VSVIALLSLDSIKSYISPTRSLALMEIKLSVVRVGGLDPSPTSGAVAETVLTWGQCGYSNLYRLGTQRCRGAA
jgi:hypothetical protein